MAKLEIRKKSHKYTATIEREKSHFALNLEIEVDRDHIYMVGADNLATVIDLKMNIRFLDAFIRLLQEINGYHKAMGEQFRI